MSRREPVVRRLAVWFFGAEALGAAAWWVTLVARPGFRGEFLAPYAPDVMLFSFAASDALFIGTAALLAFGLQTRAAWASPLLWIHVGLALYAALYPLSLAILTGGHGWMGALLMAPSLFVPGAVAWALRASGDAAP